MPPPTDDLERSKAMAASGATRWSYEHTAAYAAIYGVFTGTSWGLLSGFIGTASPGYAVLSGAIFGTLSGAGSYVVTRGRAQRWRGLVGGHRGAGHT
jgi:hypothetical protein